MVQTVQKTVEIYGLDHRDFTVAVQLKYGRCPCCVRRAGLWTLLGDDFRNVSVSPRFDSGYLFGVSLRVLLEEFHIFYVKDVPEVDSRPARFKLEIWTLFQQAALMTSLKGFSPHFAVFFALRPAGRECPFISPRWRRVLRCRGLGVAGTPGV